MPLKLKCSKCGGVFICNRYTTKLRGPVVLLSCTDCDEMYERNFSKFVETQFEEGGVIAKATGMIDLAKAIVERVGEEAAFKKKKKD